LLQCANHIHLGWQIEIVDEPDEPIATGSGVDEPMTSKPTGSVEDPDDPTDSEVDDPTTSKPDESTGSEQEVSTTSEPDEPTGSRPDNNSSSSQVRNW